LGGSAVVSVAMPIASLPLFDVALSKGIFESLLNTIGTEHPRLASLTEVWARYKHLDVGHGDGLLDLVPVLTSAIAGYELAPDHMDYADLEEFRSRLAWLNHDLDVAPCSIPQPITVRASEGGFGPNLVQLVVGEGFSWSASPYLLGVLLGELHRTQGLPLSSAHEIDQAGSLDIRDLDNNDLLEAIKRTVKSIVRSDAGRDFEPRPSGHDVVSKHGLTEFAKFSQLQQLLAINT